MNIYEDKRQSVCYRFDAFCKKVMRFEAHNCYRTMKRRQKHEISLDSLMEEYNHEPPNLHNSFIVQPMQFVSTKFYINRQAISIENERLETALLQLPEKKRELILLLYFSGVTEKEVAKMYGCCKNS